MSGTMALVMPGCAYRWRPCLRSYVGGTWRDGVRIAADLNPARPSERVSDVLQADDGIATEAADAAAKAFPAWRATPAPARGDILRNAADLLELGGKNPAI